MNAPFFVLLAFAALTIGCAQVQVIMPNPRVETPETRGGAGRWKFIVAGGDAHIFRSTANGGERPPNLDEPTVKGFLNMAPAATISPWAPLELGAEVNVLGAGLGLLAKWQVFGAQTADAGS